MAAKIALLMAVGLAIAPAVATLGAGQDVREAADRRVELHGPIFGFTQTQDRIQVRLAPARSATGRVERQHVIVRSVGGEPGEVEARIALPIRKGQTWLSASLPPELAQADMLIVSVE